MTAFRLLGGTNAAELRRALWERFRVKAVVIERPEQLIIRVSTHFYNTEIEVDRRRRRWGNCCRADVPAGGIKTLPRVGAVPTAAPLSPRCLYVNRLFTIRKPV
jgi:hypothetical protein